MIQNWEIGLIAYVGMAVGIGATMFRLRRTYTPLRTKLMPSIIACFVSGIVWGVVLPVVLVRCKKH